MLLTDLQASEITGLNAEKIDNFRDDEVNLLWLKAITKSDLDQLTAGTMTLDEIVTHEKDSGQ